MAKTTKKTGRAARGKNVRAASQMSRGTTRKETAMADKTSNNADFIGRVVEDAKNPPETRMLTGWFGDSGEEGYRRLYTDAELSSYVDIPDDAILYTEPIRDSQPAGAVLVWIKRDAAVKQGGSAFSRAARFLQGQVQQDFAGAAASGLRHRESRLPLRDAGSLRRGHRLHRQLYERAAGRRRLALYHGPAALLRGDRIHRQVYAPAVAESHPLHRLHRPALSHQRPHPHPAHLQHRRDRPSGLRRREPAGQRRRSGRTAGRRGRRGRGRQRSRGAGNVVPRLQLHQDLGPLRDAPPRLRPDQGLPDHVARLRTDQRLSDHTARLRLEQEPDLHRSSRLRLHETLGRLPANAAAEMSAVRTGAMYHAVIQPDALLS